MGDHTGRPGAVNLDQFIGVDLNLWPAVYIACWHECKMNQTKPNQIYIVQIYWTCQSQIVFLTIVCFKSCLTRRIYFISTIFHTNSLIVLTCQFLLPVWEKTCNNANNCPYHNIEVFINNYIHIKNEWMNEWIYDNEYV